MTIIKGSTKKGQNMLKTACNNEGVNLWEVYETCSRAKQNSFNQCKAMCNAENGTDFHICSHNTFSYSVAWEVENGMRMETAQNSYLILFPEYC